MNSKYFLRAFTGDFKVRNANHISKKLILTKYIQEATSNVIELHDDKPDDFEALLKSIYTTDYDTNTVGNLVLADDTSLALNLIGIYVVADKYDVTRISAAVMKATPPALHEATDEAITAAIKAYYDGTALVGSKIGTAIAQEAYTQHSKLMSSAEFEELVRSYPAFGADVALAVVRKPKPEPKIARFCLMSGHSHGNVVTKEMLESEQIYFYCAWCGSRYHK